MAKSLMARSLVAKSLMAKSFGLHGQVMGDAGIDPASDLGSPV
jgi:hypothetical protein